MLYSLILLFLERKKKESNVVEAKYLMSHRRLQVSLLKQYLQLRFCQSAGFIYKGVDYS